MKNKELTNKWVAAMRRDKWFPSRASRICSTHFEEKYMYFTNNQRRLLANTVPSIFSFPKHLQTIRIERPPPNKRLRVDSFEVASEERSPRKYKLRNIYTH